MLIERLQVFDDYTSATSANPAWTVSTMDEFLGKFDQIAVHALVDDVNATGGSFVLEAERSADGQHWDPVATSIASGTIFDIPANPFAGAMLNSVAFVRLKMYFAGATTRGHVRVVVSGRDHGAAAEVAEEIKARKGAESVPCVMKHIEAAQKNQKHPTPFMYNDCGYPPGHKHPCGWVYGSKPKGYGWTSDHRCGWYPKLEQVGARWFLAGCEVDPAMWKEGLKCGPPSSAPKEKAPPASSGGDDTDPHHQGADD